MEISETITTTVSLLGGPNLSPQDIDWALDLPAGRRLLEWLVSQVDLGLPPAKDGTCASEQLHAALQAISIEDAELQMLNATRKASRTAGTRSETQSDSKPSSDYIPPWRLKAKEEYMCAEAARLEKETEVLKARLRQTKVASQSLSQAIKCIASEIDKSDSEILAAEHDLSELSLKSDTAIRASVDSGLLLLDEVIPNQGSSKDRRSPAESLSTAESVTSAISSRFQSQVRAIDDAASRLPAPSYLQAECARLTAALFAPRVGGKSLFAAATDAAFEREVERLCQVLQDPQTGADALAALLAEDLERPEAPTIDVTAELERGWALDQAAILEAREAALDEAIAAYADTLLPPLTALHDDLAATNVRMREAQALVGALGEELQEIVEDLPEPLESPGGPSTGADADLQLGLVNLLKQTKDLRPRDAPPLVLLTEADILAELQRVYEWEEASKRQEEAWAADLLPRMRNLEQAHAPMLDLAYAHSHMNTSPPFALPAAVRAVQADAKTKADELGDAIAKLQEEVKTLESDRAKRRLEHFVAKWAK
ncbi:hypothetical protein B0H15DRAFT_820305 [Mycena belliarum]|uniref:Uncharacterized protein n=1 Tax=Mycena belliarum TaxID=1033014 RepID=A0AAD6UCZ5_9AGAR|nr:hypothetical protein B0H15DRAFT_820305 [Mycena belliae]